MTFLLPIVYHGSMDGVSEGVQYVKALPPEPEDGRGRMFRSLGLLLALAVLLGILNYVFNFGLPMLPTQTLKKDPLKAVAKVGEELIYQGDLDTEALMVPPTVPNRDKVILGRIVKDSVILQGARAEKLVTLNDTIYNSPKKDYVKRLSAVEKVQKTVEDRVDTLTGSLMSIFFLNNHVGPLGYEKAKQIAYEKLFKLREDAANKKITAEQAGELIKQDVSLEQLDPSYKTNAIYNFTVTKNQPITPEKKLNDAAWSLTPGGVTEVFTLRSADYDDNYRYKDAYYSFIHVSGKKFQGGDVDFKGWYDRQAAQFPVTVYK